jgi:hypothetical protein
MGTSTAWVLASGSQRSACGHAGPSDQRQASESRSSWSGVALPVIMLGWTWPPWRNGRCWPVSNGVRGGLVGWPRWSAGSAPATKPATTGPGIRVVSAPGAAADRCSLRARAADCDYWLWRRPPVCGPAAQAIRCCAAASIRSSRSALRRCCWPPLRRAGLRVPAAHVVLERGLNWTLSLYHRGPRIQLSRGDRRRSPGPRLLGGGAVCPGSGGGRARCCRWGCPVWR